MGPPAESLTLEHSIIGVSPTRRWQHKHQSTGFLSINLRAVETLCCECPPLEVLTPLLGVSLSESLMLVCSVMRVSPFRNGEASTNLWAPLSTGLRAVETLRCGNVPTQSLKFADIVDGITPTRRQHRKLTKTFYTQPTMPKTNSVFQRGTFQKPTINASQARPKQKPILF